MAGSSAIVNRARNALEYSLLADSLALGAHWVYNTAELSQKLGRVDKLLAPTLNNYHAGKTAGAQTHYGDQTLILLEFLASSPSALTDLQESNTEPWRSAWKSGVTADSWKGFMDHATKDTLTSTTGSASASTDIAGAARIAPILFAAAKRGLLGEKGAANSTEDEEQVVRAAVAQTATTHNSDMVKFAAEFFARVASRLLTGRFDDVDAALDSVVADLERPGDRNKTGKGMDAVKKALKTGRTGLADDEALRSFGEEKTYPGLTINTAQSCSVDGALPVTVHLIAKYKNDAKEALVRNVGLGGDQAARGLLIGLVLGAQANQPVPVEWASEWAARKRVDEAVAKLK
eukprot:ANDGO_04177.mRNA.1 hypothetical protein EMIHUDRAFT_118625